MSKSGSGAKSKRSAKSASAGSIAEVASVRKQQMQTSTDHIVKLRQALFTPQGMDKDVTKSILPLFLQVKLEERSLGIHFSARLSAKERRWAFDLSKKNMAGVDLDMTDNERMDDLKVKANRFLVIREPTTEDEEGRAVGYAMFRFTMQGELLDEMVGEPALFVYDLQVESQYQRKGLGKRLMFVLELIAKQEGMSFISIVVPDECVPMESFVKSKLPSYEEDEFDYLDAEEVETGAITVYHKCVSTSVSKTVVPGPVGVLGPVVTDSNKQHALEEDRTQPAR